jgi:hypothetical protein
MTGISHTVTLASGITVQGGGTIGDTGSGTFAGTWVNAGTINANSGNTLTFGPFFGGNFFSNSSTGTWE